MWQGCHWILWHVWPQSWLCSNFRKAAGAQKIPGFLITMKNAGWAWGLCLPLNGSFPWFRWAWEVRAQCQVSGWKTRTWSFILYKCDINFLSASAVVLWLSGQPAMWFCRVYCCGCARHRASLSWCRDASGEEVLLKIHVARVLGPLVSVGFPESRAWDRD